MKYRAIIYVFLFCWLFSYGISVEVSAQPANWWTRLPCEYIPQSDAIFIGDVAAVGPAEKNENEADKVLIEFVVREAISGTVRDAKITASSYAYPADYIGIAPGKRFIVYLANEQGKTVLRSESKEISKAAADLAFLRDWDQKDPSAKIFGRLSLIVKSSLDKNSKQPIPAANLRIQSDELKKTYNIATDENGNYELDGLTPGIYKVEALIPENSHLYTYASSTRLFAKGCTQTDVEISYENELHGKVVDPTGKPVGKVHLELIPINYVKPPFDVWGPQESAFSNDDGSFVIYNAPPGKYHLAVNYTYLPEFETPYPTSFFPGTPDRSKAQVIEIAAGKKLDGIKFVLGPERLVERKMTGRVTYADGRPVPNTKVILKEDENPTCCVLKEATTDAQGNFVLTGFATRKYRIWTYVDHKPFTEKINYFGASNVFILDAKTAPFQIVLKPTLKEGPNALDELEMRERGKIR